MRQQGGADGAVGRGELAANRSGKAMHRAEARIGQSEPAKQAGDGHIRPGGGVAAIGEGRAQRTGGAANPFHAQRIGHRVGAGANVRFDELRERIQPGAGGDGGRQIVSQLRVNDRDFRQHERAAQAHFDPVLRRGEHGVAGDFGTGARSRRDRNKRRGRFGQRFAAADHFQVVEQLARVGEHRGNGFAGVQRAAAAEADDQAAVLLLGQRDALLHGLKLRFAGNREGDGAEPVLAQQSEQRLSPPGVGARDHQGAGRKLPGERAHLAQGARRRR